VRRRVRQPLRPRVGRVAGDGEVHVGQRARDLEHLVDRLVVREGAHDHDREPLRWLARRQRRGGGRRGGRGGPPGGPPPPAGGPGGGGGGRRGGAAAPAARGGRRTT